jgi:signal transduction histidine kinase/CheY-like chemotaxis protein
MSDESKVEQKKKDYYETALQIGATLDLSTTCKEALKVCALALDVPFITLEVLDETSMSELGSKLQFRNEKASRDAERIPRVEPIGKFALMHFEATDGLETDKLVTLLCRRIELAWRSCLQQHEIEASNRALAKRIDMDRKIGRSLAHVTNNMELSSEIEKLLEMIVSTEFTATYFLNQETNNLELLSAKGFEDWEMEDALKTAWFRHPGHVIRTGEVIDVPDTLQDKECLTSTSMRRHKIRSRFFIPVRFGDDVIGALGLASSIPNCFQDGHRDILNFLADIAGLTWGRIREEKGRERRERMLHTNAKISSTLMTTPNFHEVSKQVLELLANAVYAVSATIIEFSPKSASPGVVAAWPPENTGSESVDFCTKHRETLLEGKEVVTPARSDSTSQETYADRTQMIGVPLRSGNTTRGAVVVKVTEQFETWSEVALDTIKQVANAIASADCRCRLEAELRHSQKLEAIGTLAGGIAHEFNNLLWPILSYTQLLKERTTDSTSFTMLEAIENASTKATKQVSQVLDRCRIDEPDSEIVDLKSVIMDSLHFLKRSIPAVIVIDENLNDVGNANIDVSEIHQVVLNVCTNACQAMDKGGTITVRLFKSDFEDAVLEVSDNGAGMDEYPHNHLFDEYFSSKKSGKETGLGMSIVHKIIEDMGGSISTSTVPTEGTTVAIRIPLLRDAVQSTTIDFKGELNAPFKGITVFIVDDDTAVRTMCTEIIESFEYEVEAFADPRDLVTAFTNTEKRPSVIITDLSMPVMDGIELTKILRKIDQEIPIICCTGFGSESLEREALESGVSAFARKPLRVEDFGRLLRNAIEENLLT